MTAALIILLAWVLFGGSHIVLSSSALRPFLSNRFGPKGFTLFYTVVTVVTMSCLIYAATRYGGQGRVGPDLGQYVFMKWGLVLAAFMGAILMIAGLINYPHSPMAELAKRQRQMGLEEMHALKPPRHIDQLSRHPFFVGLIIVMGAHTLLATTLANAVYFGGFVATAAIGIPLQDRKLRRKWQDIYRSYETQTSVLPFNLGDKDAVNSSKRQWIPWIISVLVSLIVFVGMHKVWAYANGAVFAGFILVFGTLAVLAAIRKS